MEIIALVSGSIGSLITVLTFFGIRIGKRYMFKNETQYGEQAEKRFEHINKTVHTGIVFPPMKYKGGEIKTPQLKIERLTYDKDTMPPEWKGLSKTVQFFRKENEEIIEYCWRIR